MNLGLLEMLRVDEAIVKELQCLDTDVPEASGCVRFLQIGGDQPSTARLRAALEFIYAGQEEGYEGFFWGALDWIPGLFHVKIADAHGTLLNHFGKPNSGSIQLPWFFKTHIWINCP